MGGEDEDSHSDGGCPGMWRLVESALDPELGALTLYRCELCDSVLPVGPGGVHPATA